MAFTSTVRKWWASWRCCPGVKVPTGFFGRTPVYAANDAGILAVQALEQAHLGSGYVPTSGGYIGSKRQCPSGIGGKTCQPDGYNCSIHNYCMAWDIEYQYNQYIRSRVTEADFNEPWFPSVCKYTLDQVRAIEGVKNVFGEQMFLWLGWAIGDFMHWQINVPPTRMDVDWNTVPGDFVVIPEGETMFCKYSDGFGTTDGNEVVRYWQNLLAELGVDLGSDGVDGKYGSATVAGVSSLLPFSDGQQINGDEAAALIVMIGELGDSSADALFRGDAVVLA